MVVVMSLINTVQRRHKCANVCSEGVDTTHSQDNLTRAHSKALNQMIRKLRAE